MLDHHGQGAGSDLRRPPIHGRAANVLSLWPRMRQEDEIEEWLGHARFRTLSLADPDLGLTGRGLCSHVASAARYPRAAMCLSMST
jgi:hypothetical protein